MNRYKQNSVVQNTGNSSVNPYACYQNGNAFVSNTIHHNTKPYNNVPSFSSSLLYFSNSKPTGIAATNTSVKGELINAKVYPESGKMCTAAQFSQGYVTKIDGQTIQCVKDTNV
jgi:hypothetical protein